ncbi:MAG: class I SAM-dependent methyltransferase [Verrucomicrobiales bacterium]|nr:class I SAM-dependent methyltransferase [Verrucomicrobiales bacterium]
MIVDYVAGLVRRLVPATGPLKHLDLGAGWGDLIRRLREHHPQIRSWGVDYNPSHFGVPDVEVKHADFSVDRLAYDDATFDLVTCTEVVEHLENFRHAMREAARVLKPGGWMVVSTPNVLSLKSRWAYFTRGFFTYFDPLPSKDDPRMYPGQRHITPLPFFYLAHALHDAGFVDIAAHADKVQRSSAFWATILGPVLTLVAGSAHRRRIRHFGALNPELEKLAQWNNSWPVLTGRTLIVSAKRASGTP